MISDASIYDLGDVDTDRSRRQSAPPGSRHMHRTDSASTRRQRRRWMGPGSVSLFVPGLGQILHGDTMTGLLFLTATGFLVSLAWAVHDTLSGFSRTLSELGGPSAGSVWLLGAIHVAVVILHLANVAHVQGLVASQRRLAPRHPFVAGMASLLFPGWGQVLNGARVRSVVCLFFLWLTATGWLLASAPAVDLLDSLRLHLPAQLEVLTTHGVMWTLPAVVWSLAVYDAVSSARAARVKQRIIAALSS